MDATPVDFGISRTDHGLGSAGTGAAEQCPMARKWATLHEAAAVVAVLAGIDAGALVAQADTFPQALRDGAGWRRDLADQAIDDIAAMMEPGLSALLTIYERGGDPAAPALALWQEFDRARGALLAMAPEHLHDA